MDSFSRSVESAIGERTQNIKCMQEWNIVIVSLFVIKQGSPYFWQLNVYSLVTILVTPIQMFGPVTIVLIITWQFNISSTASRYSEDKVLKFKLQNTEKKVEVN